MRALSKNFFISFSLLFFYFESIFASILKHFLRRRHAVAARGRVYTMLRNLARPAEAENFLSFRFIKYDFVIIFDVNFWSKLSVFRTPNRFRGDTARHGGAPSRPAFFARFEFYFIYTVFLLPAAGAEKFHLFFFFLKLP